MSSSNPRDELVFDQVKSVLQRIAFAVHPAPLFFAFMFALALAFVGQFHEIYVSYLEELYNPATGPGRLHTIAALSAMVLFSAGIYIANSSLGRYYTEQVYRDRSESVVDPQLDRLVSWVGVFAAGLPWVGLLAGLQTAIEHARRHIENVVVPPPGAFEQCIDKLATAPTDTNCILGILKRLGPERRPTEDIRASAQDFFSVSPSSPEPFNFLPVDIEHLKKFYGHLATLDDALRSHIPAGTDWPTFWNLLLVWSGIIAVLLILGYAMTLLKAATVYCLPEGYAGFIRKNLRAQAWSPTMNLAQDRALRFRLERLPRYYHHARATAVWTIGFLVVIDLLVPFLILVLAGKPAGLDQGGFSGLRSQLEQLSRSLWLETVPGQAAGEHAIGYEPVSAWLLSVVGLLLVHLAASIGYFYSRRRPALRTALGLAIWLIRAILVGVIVSGIWAIGWTAIARQLGPFAAMLTFFLIVFAIIIAFCHLSRQTGIPLFIVFIVATVVVTVNKLIQGGADYPVAGGSTPIRFEHGLLRWIAEEWSRIVARFGETHLFAYVILALLLGLALWLRRHALKRSAAIVGGIVGVGILGIVAPQFFPDGFLPPDPSARRTGAAQGANDRVGPATGGAAQEARRDIGAAFDAWYAARLEAKPRSSAGEPPYPVFIIAAEGGGIYAAAAVSAFLTRLQARCPAFAQHIFAISGVSGGSMGSVVFDAAVEAMQARRGHALVPDGCSAATAAAGPGKARRDLQSLVAEVIKADHLSPILGLAAPEILGLYHDRGEGLRFAFDTSMTRAFDRLKDRPRQIPKADDRPIWGKPYREHWSAARAQPALVLNTTWVKVGNRVAFSPFDLERAQDLKDDRTEYVTFNTFLRLSEFPKCESELVRHACEPWAARQRNLTLTQAAVTSARFPGVLAAMANWRTTGKGTRHASFVDGGYVDSSGALTASDIYDSLTRHLEHKALRDKVDLRVILLTSTQSDDEELGTIGAELRDVAAPVTALFSVRGLLSRNAVRETVKKIGGARDVEDLSRLQHPAQRTPLDVKSEADRDRAANWKVATIGLNLDLFNMELGWKISTTTYDVVSLQLGQADLCEKAQSTARDPRRPRVVNPGDPRGPETAKTIRANSCVMASIERLIGGGTGPGAAR